MAPTSKDGSRRGNCPLFGGGGYEACGRAQCKGLREGDWRASSVPAAAVIPAPRVSTVDAAVKGSVVGAAEKGCCSAAHVLQELAERTEGAV